MSSAVVVLVFAAFAFPMNVWRPVAAGITVAQADIFETPSEVTVTSNGMMVTAPQVRTVMMVKRADDGTLVTSCVSSAAAAEEFVRPKTRNGDVTKAQEK